MDVTGKSGEGGPEDRRGPSPRRSPPDGRDGPDTRLEEVSLLQLTNVLLRHRRLVVLAPVVVGFLVVVFTLLGPRSYTSTASFTPESGGDQAGRLSGLASQFGVQVPTGSAGESPQFYADLLSGRALLREAVLTEYEASVDSERPDGEPRHGDLVSLFEIEGDTRLSAVAKTIEELRDQVSVATDTETGVVELSVTTRWPDISRQIADRMIELVNRFNLERRQSRASAEREFTEEQVARAESALHAAEDSLQRFLEQNRNYQNSPALRFQHDRLQRRVTLRQQIFTSLSESFEQSRIDEVRNTPVITVVEPPELPARPDSRNLLLRGLLGLMLGGMLGGFWAFGREMMATSRERDPDAYAEFKRLRREARAEIEGLWSRLRGVFR